MGVEVTQEVLWMNVESPRGTPAVPSLALLVAESDLTPEQTDWTPSVMDGTRAEFSSTVIMREESTFSCSGPLDLAAAVMLNRLWAGAVVGPTQVGATLAYDTTFTSDVAGFNARSATIYRGDPDFNIFRAPYHMLESLEITWGADSDEGAQFSLSTRGGIVETPSPSPMTFGGSALTAPAYPTPLYVSGLNADLWIDTGVSAIGTTSISGRMVSGAIRINRVISRKYHAVGASGAKTFDRVAPGKDHAEVELVFEFDDLVQYNLFKNNTTAKTRVRLYGDLLDTGTYAYYQFDIYGPLRGLEWETYMDTNRTLRLTARSHYNADARAAGHDYRSVVRRLTGSV